MKRILLLINYNWPVTENANLRFKISIELAEL